MISDRAIRIAGITVRWGHFKPSQPTRRVAKVGPNQTVTTAHPRPHRGAISSRPTGAKSGCHSHGVAAVAVESWFQSLMTTRGWISDQKLVILKHCRGSNPGYSAASSVAHRNPVVNTTPVGAIASR